MTKKLMLASSLTFAMLTITSSSALPLPASAKIEKNLRQNMRGVEVAELQDKLKKEGVFNEKVPSTGFFGPVTTDALKQFQKKNNLPTSGFVDAATREELNKTAKASAPSTSKAEIKVAAPTKKAEADIKKTSKIDADLETSKQIEELRSMIKILQARLVEALKSASAGNVAGDDQSGISDAQTSPVIDTPKGTEADDTEKETQVKKSKDGTVHVGTPEQLTAGVFIHGGISGPGYPTGPLNLSLPATQLLLDNLGQGNPATDISGRQYEAPLDTIPPTMGAFPFTFNGVTNTATSLKVISNLKTKNGVSQHTGTIDVDIDTLPGGHLTLSYSGTAVVAGSTITSNGTFKTAGATGLGGLVASGTYSMTISESGATIGSPVTITLTTVAP